MPYITKKTPTPRSTDTALGKMLGYMAELLEYLKWEGYALEIDVIFPDYFPFGNIQGFLIDICKRVYEANYQKAFNHGADYGNQANQQILGWLDDLKKKSFAQIDATADWINKNWVTPLKTKIESEILPRVNQAVSRLSTLETGVNNAITRVNQLGTNVNSMDTQLRNFASQIESQRTKVNEIVERTNRISSRLSDLQAFINDLDRRLKIVEGKQPSVFPSLKL